MSTNIYRSTPRNIRRFVEKCLLKGLVPFLKSSPGLGKSSIIRQVAKKYRLKVIDIRLSTRSETDFSGLPQFIERDGKQIATFTQFDIFPTEDTPIPKGYDGWLVFFDEITSGSEEMEAACYEIILDKKVGDTPLHPMVAMACASNLTTDRAIARKMGTAMQSRVIHLEMMESYSDWVRDVAIPGDYDFRLMAFLAQYPSYLTDFKPDHSEETFSCPRTWEFMNTLIQGEEVIKDDLPLYAGTITSGMAVKFVEFCGLINDIIPVSDIIAHPETCRLPTTTDNQWATVASMSENVTEDNFGAMSIYANRFPLTFRILFFRSVHVRKPILLTHPAFAVAMSEMNKYLNG